VGAEAIPPAVALGVLRDEIARNRGTAPATMRGALSFGVAQPDGLTAWWSLYIERDGVRLVEGAVPIQYRGRLATLFTSVDALSGILRGAPGGLEVEGDTALLEEVSGCLDGPLSLYGVRSKQ